MLLFVWKLRLIYNYIFMMLRNFTIGRYLCLHKHRCRNLGAYLNTYSCESFFLSKGNSAIRLNYWSDNSEKFKEFRKNEDFDLIPCEGFFGNTYSSHVLLKIQRYLLLEMFMRKLQWNGRRKVFGGVLGTHSSIYDEAFLRK